MVVQGQMEVKLVDADNKTFEFPEHVKNEGGQMVTYVEAEPNAEYYVAIRRPGSTQSDQKALVCRVTIDGQDLGPGMIFYRSSGWGYIGLTDGDNDRALRFVTPRATGAVDSSIEAEGFRSMPVGKIKVTVQEADVLGDMIRRQRTTESKQLQMPEVSGMIQEDLVKKKFIGCTGGTNSKATSSWTYSLNYGRFIDTVEIRYATFYALLFNKILNN
jgi:hypothetical protein